MAIFSDSQEDRLSQIRPVPPKKTGPPKIFRLRRYCFRLRRKLLGVANTSFAVAKHMAILYALRSTAVLPVPRTGQADSCRS